MSQSKGVGSSTGMKMYLTSQSSDVLINVCYVAPAQLSCVCTLYWVLCRAEWGCQDARRAAPILVGSTVSLLPWCAASTGKLFCIQAKSVTYRKFIWGTEHVSDIPCQVIRTSDDAVASIHSIFLLKVNVFTYQNYRLSSQGLFT